MLLHSIARLLHFQMLQPGRALHGIEYCGACKAEATCCDGHPLHWRTVSQLPRGGRRPTGRRSRISGQAYFLHKLLSFAVEEPYLIMQCKLCCWGVIHFMHELTRLHLQLLELRT